MRLELRKLLRIPGPVELGMSKYEALGCREMTPFQDTPMWEDYYTRIKEEYPVRYFLSEVVGRWFSSKLYSLNEWQWALRHRYIYRSHLIDTRGVDPLSPKPFDYGYMDPCYSFWIAGWHALRRHVEKDEPTDPADPDSGFTEEDRASDWFKSQKANYDEIQALYHYWMVTRPEESEESLRLYEIQKEDGRRQDKEAWDISHDKWLNYHRECEEREEEMFLRLVKVRQYLWR